MAANQVVARDTLTDSTETYTFNYYSASDGKIYIREKSNYFSKPTLMIHFTEASGQPFYSPVNRTYTYRSSISGIRPAENEWDFQLCPSGGIPNASKDCYTQDYQGFAIASSGTLYYERSGDTHTFAFFDYKTFGKSISGRIVITDTEIGKPDYDGTHQDGSL